MSALLYDKDDWLFAEPQKNIVHDITLDDINQLLHCAQQDEAWAEGIKEDVIQTDEKMRKGIDTGSDWLLNQHKIRWTCGTVIQMPFGPRIITYPSKPQLFRGENQNYHKSLPSLRRRLSGFKDEKEINSVIAFLRKWRFANLIWNINIVPFWEAKLSDVNFDALAQHYGFPTYLLDLTNDFRAALFFATCKYEEKTDSYRPLTQDDIDGNEDSAYGYIFHAPDWCIDFLNGGGFSKWSSRNDPFAANSSKVPRQDRRFYLQNGDMDGAALQIGYQPLQRCAHQSGYIYPMRNEAPLQEDWHFEKLRFRQSIELSQQVYKMMDNGKKVFPHEGINELRSYIEDVKHSVMFSMDELNAVFEEDGIDRNIFPTLGDLKRWVTGYKTEDGVIGIQEEPVEQVIPDELLKLVNEHYDGKDLLAAIGGMIHQTGEDKRYREERCREIFGELI